MDYLARESVDLSDQMWSEIDKAVIGTLKQQLIARRFLKIAGPFGAGTTSVRLSSVNEEEILEDGVARIKGATELELPMFFEDFYLFGRDMEHSEQSGHALDLSAALRAAKRAANREDELIMLGNKALGTEGLSTAKASFKIKKGDWSRGETAYMDIVKAVSHLAEAGYLGRYALVLSIDLYLALQHLAADTGLLEVERIKKLIGDNVYSYAGFGTNKAVLVCAEPENMDLALGLDFSVGYVELVDFNHHFRIMETAALRIKDPAAIVVFN